MSVKNLSQFKKALTIGSKWKCTYFFGTTVKEIGTREVSIKQTNAVAFKTETGDSWLQFNSAKYYRFENGKIQVFSESGRIGDTELRLNLEYELVE